MLRRFISFLTAVVLAACPLACATERAAGDEGKEAARPRCCCCPRPEAPRDATPGQDQRPASSGDCVCHGAVIEQAVELRVAGEGFAFCPPAAVDMHSAVASSVELRAARGAPLADDGDNPGRVRRLLFASLLC